MRDLRHTVFNSESKPMITWTVVKALGFQYQLLFVSCCPSKVGTEAKLP